MSLKASIVVILVVMLSMTSIAPSEPFNAKGDTVQISNKWVPYGPSMKNLLLQFYTDTGAEFRAFFSNPPTLDVLDSPLNADNQPNITCQLSTVVCTPPVSANDIFGVDFAHDQTFWGCSFAIPSNPCAVEIRRGLAHLFHKQTFVSSFLGLTASQVDCFSPPVQNLPCQNNVSNGNTPPWDACSWDPLYHTKYFGCYSGYNFGGTETSYGGVTGGDDFCAAADHFINAGLATGKNPNTCVLTGLTGVAANDRIYFWINSEDKALFQMGNTFVDAINSLMGRKDTTNWAAAKCPITMTQLIRDFATPTAGFASASPWDHLPGLPVESWISPAQSPKPGVAKGPSFSFDSLICFKGSDFSTITSNVYNMITTGWATPPPNSLEQLYLAYNSAVNTDGFSAPTVDHWSSMLEFNHTMPAAIQSALATEYWAGSYVANIPMWSSYLPFIYLKGWNGVISQVGDGTPNAITAIDASNPRPAVADTIRWGMTQDTGHLSPFYASTASDFFVLGELYSSMLIQNPMDSNQIIDWMTTSHSSTYDAKEISCIGAKCATGTTTQIYHLRNDLYFHDGTPVTATDVAYTLIAYRDVPSVSFGARVSLVSSATGTDCATGSPCKTLQVKLQGDSPFFEYDIGSLPIIPKHVWQSYCGDPPSPTSQCANYYFDPVKTGIVVGSGPFVCRDLNNNIGRGCTSSGDQFLSVGGAIVLRAFLNVSGQTWMRCCPGAPGSPLYRFSYSDKNNDGIVNILDLADAFSQFGKPDPYWVNPYIAPGTTVNVQDLAVVSFYFGHSLIGSFTPQTTTGLGPIDPFFPSG